MFGVAVAVAFELRSDIAQGSSGDFAGNHARLGAGTLVVELLGRYIVLGLICAFRSES